MEKESTSESRRKFLKTAGKFAVYTPPALMLMSKASATYVKGTVGQCDSYKCSDRYKKKKEYYRKKKSIIIRIRRWLRRWYA